MSYVIAIQTEEEQKETRRRVMRILEVLDPDSCGGAFLWGEGVRERGYGTPQTPWVLFYSWEDWTERASDLLEKEGVLVDFSDSWAQCEDCWQIVRTQPDTYSWTPQGHYFESPGVFLCDQCMTLAEVLPEAVNNPRFAIVPTWNLDAQLEEEGFTRHNSERFESGWFDGQTDDPRAILESLLEGNPSREVVFRIRTQQQFDTYWDVYVRESREEAE